MDWEKKIANTQQLLNEGKTKEVLDETQFLTSDDIAHLSHKNEAEACALRGMANYRRKDFGHAGFWFTAALDSDPANERAIYGMAYLAAYADKDPAETKEWLAKLPEGPARDDAFMEIARSPEYLSDAGVCNTECEVEEILKKWLAPNPEDPINVANILRNAARFYMEIPEDSSDEKYDKKQDFCKALAYLQGAIGLYGTGDMNLHHRAAANYWTSVAMEKVLGPAAAIPFAEQSLELWKRQLDLDPANERFDEQHKNALARVDELRKNTYSLER